MDEHLVTELIELERRIAADEYTIALTRSVDGIDANKATIVDDLQRRIMETTSRLDALRVQLAETAGPPAAVRPKRARSAKQPRTPEAEPAEAAGTETTSAETTSAETDS